MLLKDGNAERGLGLGRAQAVGAAWRVEGQAQCGLALKGRPGSLLNQLFVFCVGPCVWKGPEAQSRPSSAAGL